MCLPTPPSLPEVKISFIDSLEFSTYGRISSSDKIILLLFKYGYLYIFFLADCTVNLYLLIVVFNLLTFNVIIPKVGFMSALLFFVFVSFLFVP